MRRFLKAGKKIIITTVQKFPFVLNEIDAQHRQSRFAIIIDEAHSSQGGKTATAMNRVLDERPEYIENTLEDRINAIMASRKDAEDLRRAAPAIRRHGKAPSAPQLHHEAGHSGGLYP